MNFHELKILDIFLRALVSSKLTFVTNIRRYVSSDFGNHPLSHLMGSVFGMHNREHVEVRMIRTKLST